MPEYVLHVLNLSWEAESPEEAVRQATARGVEGLVWTVTDREVEIVPADAVVGERNNGEPVLSERPFALAFRVKEEVDMEEMGDERD